MLLEEYLNERDYPNSALDFSPEEKSHHHDRLIEDGQKNFMKLLPNDQEEVRKSHDEKMQLQSEISSFINSEKLNFSGDSKSV
jgi:hypothetical protein